jgi:preprotein translocase subunit SecY
VIQLRSFKNIFLVPELRNKILFTLGVLIVDRLGSYIPVPGVDVGKLSDYLSQASLLGSFFNYLDTFSGGGIGRCTIFALGISPYITSSIMMQLLGMSIPSLEALMKEGEYGRKIIDQYTRYLTLGLAVLYSTSYALALQSGGMALTPGLGFVVSFVLTMSAGSLFVMWLGEQISLFGIGNGASMIIFAGIASRFPGYVFRTIKAVDMGSITVITALFILFVFLAITCCIVYLEKGERKIPVQYARRVVSNKVFGGQSSFIPFKINTVGVMPVIFASAMLQMPMSLINYLATKYSSLSFLTEWLSFSGFLFNSFEFLLIVFFTFVYTALVFNPEERAEEMKKNGAFIPGVRPGNSTAVFIEKILNRIGLIGAVYLAALSIIPNIMTGFINMPFYLGGTALLIAVGVALELANQIESYLIEHRYEGFTAKK